MHISARKCRVLSDIIELLSADYGDSRDLRSTIGGSLLDLLEADLCMRLTFGTRRSGRSNAASPSTWTTPTWRRTRTISNIAMRRVRDTGCGTASIPSAPSFRIAI
jgi:hypothetical protein